MVAGHAHNLGDNRQLAEGRLDVVKGEPDARAARGCCRFHAADVPANFGAWPEGHPVGGFEGFQCGGFEFLVLFGFPGCEFVVQLDQKARARGDRISGQRRRVGRLRCSRGGLVLRQRRRRRG